MVVGNTDFFQTPRAGYVGREFPLELVAIEEENLQCRGEGGRKLEGG